jgi:uncharacterized protein involved in cysteine biosynthesis
LKQLKLFPKNIFKLLVAIKVILSKPVYVFYILISVVFNIIIFVLLIYIFVLLLDTVTDNFQHFLNIENTNSYFDISVQLIQIIIGIVVSAFLFPTLSTVANSFVYDFLSERVLKDNNIYPKSDKNFIQVSLNAVTFELKKMLIAIILLLLTFLLNLIPVIGSVLSILITYINIILLNGLDSLNAPLSTQDYIFREKMKFITINPSTWGYLFITANLNGIPVLNIVTIPISIVASSLVYKEITTLQQ